MFSVNIPVYTVHNCICHTLNMLLNVRDWKFIARRMFYQAGLICIFALKVQLIAMTFISISCSRKVLLYFMLSCLQCFDTVGHQVEHPACKNEWWGVDIRSEVQVVCIWSSWCHCRPKTPSFLASFKSWLVLPFWYWLAQVVLEKRLLNGCSGSSLSILSCKLILPCLTSRSVWLLDVELWVHLWLHFD